MLAAWYPLISNMNNQGLADSNLTVSSTPTFVSGLLGGALQGGGAGSWTSTQTASILNNTAMSFCFWVYPDAATGDTGARARFFGNDSPRHYSIFQYPTCNDLHWDWRNNAGSTVLGGVLSGVLPSYKWTHVTFTYQNPTFKIYINGVLKHTASASLDVQSYANATSVILACSGRKLCDYRVYTHCLSHKEVQLISRGLMVHYPLSNNGSGCANLAKGTNTASTSTNTFGFSEAAGGSTRTIEYEVEGGTPCAKITRNSTAHSSWSYLWYSNWDRNAIKPSTTYTLSMDVKGSGSGTIGFSAFMQGNATNSITASVETIQNTFNASGWSHLVWRTTTISDFTDKGTGQTIYMSCGFLTNTEVWIMMKNLKLEEGSVDTPWTPHTSDDAYTTMGYNSTTEYDTSGYCYNGIAEGTITYDSDTPRYSVASHFAKGAGVFGHSNVALSAFTIAFWGKHTASNKMLFGSMPTASTNNTSWYWYGDNSFKYPNGEFYYNHNAGSYILNTWMHFVVTYDGANITVYRNGVNEGSKACTGSMTLEYCSIGIGFGSIYAEEGYVSDFRLYATCLTADDIKELYNTSASIANNGVLMSYEFAET